MISLLKNGASRTISPDPPSSGEASVILGDASKVALLATSDQHRRKKEETRSRLRYWGGRDDILASEKREVDSASMGHGDVQKTVCCNDMRFWIKGKYVA
jgi:hypothetical protein